MKKLVFLSVALCLFASLAFAQEETAATEEATVNAETEEIMPNAETEEIMPNAETEEAAAKNDIDDIIPKGNTEEITLKGDIIDNLCVGYQKPEGLAEFVKTHPKQCTIMPDRIANGYSIFVDGKVLKFDKASNAKVAEFLKQELNKLQVVVVVKRSGGELSLVSIENQQ